MKNPSNMEYFGKHIKRPETLRKRYRELCKIHHPDLGGNAATFMEIDAEYRSRLKDAERKTVFTHFSKKQTMKNNTDDDNAQTNNNDQVETTREQKTEAAVSVKLGSLKMEWTGGINLKKIFSF